MFFAAMPKQRFWIRCVLALVRIEYIGQINLLFLKCFRIGMRKLNPLGFSFLMPKTVNIIKLNKLIKAERCGKNVYR